MTEHMKREAFPPPPTQRAEFDVGIVSADHEPGAVFQGRVALLLRLDFAQALELQRCLVAEMQRRFVGDEILQIWLEPGVLQLDPFTGDVPVSEDDPSQPSPTEPAVPPHLRR